ncbi:MAG: hypothetical protein KC503_40175 [Myxococcales bacterium]|nr:hypothetical protein [Myxococcales bacterium]
MARRRVLLVVIVAMAMTSACQRIASYRSGEAAPAAEAGSLDLPVLPADGPVDSNRDDADTRPIDTSNSDSVLTNVCPPLPDGDTVALYTFPAGATRPFDVVTQQPVGALAGDTTLIRFDNDATVCGSTVAIFPAAQEVSSCNGTMCDRPRPDCASAYMVVTMSDSATKRLVSGSVDLWVRFHNAANPGGLEGILSRDAIGTKTPGHFGLWREGDRIVLRVQRMDPDSDAFLCSPHGTIKDTAWHHIGVNFGALGPELYLDFVKTTPDGSGVQGGMCLGTTAKGVVVTDGLSSNSEPWVIGASNGNSCDDDAAPTRWPFRGVVANIRVSARRRDFTQLRP